MPTDKLPPGPMRDLLAFLNGGEGEQWIDAHFLADRLGWPYGVAVRRLNRATLAGYARAERREGADRYTGTQKGRDLL